MPASRASPLADGVFGTADVRAKMRALDADIERALGGGAVSPVPEIPARDAELLHVSRHPAKPRLNSDEGQARLLHDLASIELQAMELGLRTLAEFREAPALFREELAEITRGEAKHLALCLDGLESLGFGWGHWPVHTALWEAVSAQDALLDRILIVHRYLEGSGLDAGDSILRRLSGVESRVARGVARVIVDEEIGHVKFGSDWYRRVCGLEGLDAQEDFPRRMESLRRALPRRLEPVCRPLRTAAGFTESELDYLEELRRQKIAEIYG